MAKQLSSAAIEKIIADVDLYYAVTKILGLSRATSLPNTLRRNGNSVNRIDRIEAIAKAMGVNSESILEEKAPVEAAG